MRVVEEQSFFHAEVDFKCSTIFENQLARSKSATDLINRKQKSKPLLFFRYARAGKCSVKLSISKVKTK